ncbi:MAG: hypothetical protein JW953_05610 [Anaerolineae bacterium]|nr:hypothetical protein [Anaerolineae bacterium]
MLKKNILWIIGLLLVVALAAVVFPTVSQAEQGGENFVFVNYLGQEIYLDLDDVTYVVPGTGIAPEGGWLVLQLAPGQHKYAANAPGVPTGSAGEFTLAPGGFVAKAARIETTPVPVDHRGIVIGEPEDYVYVFDFNPFAAPAPETEPVDTWQPAAAAPGLGSLVWINYYGNSELTIDLSGELYKVPAKANSIPGRLQIDLDPGQYFYTASVPNGSLNGEIAVVPGQVTSFNITAEIEPPPDYDIGDEYEFLPSVTLQLRTEDLTGQVVGVAATAETDSAPAVLPTTGGEFSPAVSNPASLLIKNYTGDTLIFTINNQIYPVAPNAEKTLSLPPGSYNYTASLPYVATTGVVEMPVDEGVGLSIVTNIAHDNLSVYPN